MTIAPAASPAASSQLTGSTLRAAAGVTGMQLVYVGALDPDSESSESLSEGAGGVAPGFTWRHLQGKFDGISSGFRVELADTFDSRLLKGAPPSTADAALDPAYADVPMRIAYGITSYVGVPLRTGGIVTGVLGGIDSATVAIGPPDVRVLVALARILSAEASRDPEVRLHRTAAGWDVERGDGSESSAEDLTVAMSLADLIAGDTVETIPPPRPGRPSEGLSETERLRLQITQLEHALTARVVIEQAIGVLAQRFGVTPREAFDRIRKSARSRGQRVHELAVSIVRSARDETVTLPTDLT